ncbi:hypothetical protein BAY15_0582 [Stenotrophomonas rhizophila]|nr:hypothetical protein BAY15_0582 [Stenotrophomonas rhizophila]
MAIALDATLDHRLLLMGLRIASGDRSPPSFHMAMSPFDGRRLVSLAVAGSDLELVKALPRAGFFQRTYESYEIPR